MKIVFIITLLTAMSVFAGHDTNGGDSCERRLLDIKEDIIDWVEKDGHKDLKYENALTAEEYKEVMLRRLSEANISCTTKILSVQGAEKTCVNSMKTKDIMHFLPDEYVKKNKRALKRE